MTKIVLAYDKSVWFSKEIDLFRAIRSEIGMLKVGLESVTADLGLHQNVASVASHHYDETGAAVLLDLKLHDIPNTIASAVRNLAGEVGGVTIHASAGPSGLEAAVKARYQKIGPRSGIMPDDSTPWTTLFGVTVLTSHDEDECVHIFGEKPGLKVLQFARDCISAGIDGLVCSGKELALLREHGLTDKLETLVPGGRPAWASANDQKRVLTPAEIARLGADYAVFGRPILDGPVSPLEAIKLINEEMAAA